MSISNKFMLIFTFEILSYYKILKVKNESILNLIFFLKKKLSAVAIITLVQLLLSISVIKSDKVGQLISRLIDDSDLTVTNKSVWKVIYE